MPATSHRRASRSPTAPRHTPGAECAVCGGPARQDIRREAFEENFLFCSAKCAALFDEAPGEYAFGRKAPAED